jgi:hypothetical protein
MTDRELLELAAKAAGLIVITDAKDRGLWIAGLEDEWNPLTDDGDAFRLTVKLGIKFSIKNGATWLERVIGPGQVQWDYEQHDGDPYAATRRAIVRAAAEIGKQQEKNNGN